jgi:hypothetical protein
MFVGNIRHVCHTSRETKCLPVISARLPIMADSKKAKNMAENRWTVRGVGNRPCQRPLYQQGSS